MWRLSPAGRAEEQELERLRAIGTAVTVGPNDTVITGENWSKLADWLNSQGFLGWPVTCAAIADALAKK